MVGGNFRLDALQAAVLRVKLKRLENWITKRSENAAYYTSRFCELGLADHHIVPPKVIHERHTYNQYVIRAEDRDHLKEFLQAKNVGTEIYYPRPNHLQECLTNKGQREGRFPISEAASKSVLALPIYPELSVKQLDYVVEKIAEYYDKH